MKNLENLEGQYVRVYWNSHKRCFSVLKKTEGKWLLYGHTNDFNLRDVEFRVSELGRLRAIKEGYRNVHALVCGTFTLYQDVYEDDIDSKKVTYWLGDGAYFQIVDGGIPIYKARFVHGSVDGGKGTLLAGG